MDKIDYKLFTAHKTNGFLPRYVFGVRGKLYTSGVPQGSNLALCCS